MMKPWLSSVLALSLAASTQACAKQPAAPPSHENPNTTATHGAKPALWVVRDDDTTIYLFGTIHVLKPGVGWFDGGVKRAFDSSDQLVLELVQPDPAAMRDLFERLGTDPSGKPLTSKLPARDRALLAKSLSDLGLPATALDRYEPWVAAINLAVLPLLKLGYDPSNGPEKVLTDAARASGKTVSGLETPEQQLGYFDTLPEAAQVKFLESTLDEIPKAGQSIDGMIGAWSRGEPDKLAKVLNEGLEDQPEIGKALLYGRNARWADWIDARMKQPGTVFVAVGAGHLAGSSSVQAMLARHGLVVTRITY